jgi:hypothetical protein
MKVGLRAMLHNITTVCGGNLDSVDVIGGREQLL